MSRPLIEELHQAAGENTTIQKDILRTSPHTLCIPPTSEHCLLSNNSPHKRQTSREKNNELSAVSKHLKRVNPPNGRKELLCNPWHECWLVYLAPPHLSVLFQPTVCPKRIILVNSISALPGLWLQVCFVKGEPWQEAGRREKRMKFGCASP